MSHKIKLTFAAVAAVALGSTLVLIPGCVENAPRPAAAALPAPPPLKSEPIGVQMTRAETRLADTPFRVLLDFERRSDLAFLSAAGEKQALSIDRAHTGTSSLKFVHDSVTEIKLSSLVGSGAFPGDWTLAGAYFSSAGSASVTLAYRAASSSQPLLQKTIELSPGAAWQGVFVDLTTLPRESADAGLLGIRVEAAQPVYCDDVLLINNARTLEEPAAGATAASGWTIRQGGCAIDLNRPGHFRVTLKTPEDMPDGWISEEANDLRARFVSPSGKTWTIYADGRQYQDAQFSSLTPLPNGAALLYAQQHDSPAEMSVPEEFGRIDRDTPGDKNNDGYNERRGSYELAAKGRRLEVTLKPTSRALVHPVLEISGLPPGSPFITVEGQLIEQSTRLPNGNLLVELPLVLERATTVNVSIK